MVRGWKMGNIKLKLTAISPIHIGSGEVYEPTNFVIDGGVLYEFRDEDFFENLSEIKRRKFLQIIEESRSDSFVRVHKFVKDNKDIAKRASKLQVRVTSGFQKDYDRRVGKISQIEGKNRFVFNRFEIQRIQRKQIKSKNGYIYAGYIVGSSLKGAISTAYQEYIYKKDGENALKEKFQAKGRDIYKNIFKEFKVPDSLVTKVSTKIGFALNKERFDYDFNNPQNNIKLSTYIEVINPKSEFIVDINYGSLNIEEILESCNSHYMPIFNSILSPKTDGKEEFSNEYLEDNFYEKYKNFKLKKNQYIIRVGKHSGARAVTIDGLREIKSKISGGGRSRKPNRWETREDETTIWFFGDNPKTNSNLLPFGWVICEKI